LVHNQGMGTSARNSQDTAWIAERARAIGFDLCGVVQAGPLPELERMDEWLARGYAGNMKYLEDARRRDPRNLKKNIRSAIVCALNYNTKFSYSTEAGAPPEPDGEQAAQGWISRYAWGGDYHQVLWGMLDIFVEELHAHFGEGCEAYAYADTGPIHERVLAKYAGLGWIGKNTLLLNQHLGSWLFLGVVLTSLELQPSVPAGAVLPPDLCGTCRKCLDACPTAAFVEPYVMDARRCISYLTIELRDTIPEEFREAMGWQVFGCDICQDVCPWNRKAPITGKAEFQPRNAGQEGRNSLYMPQLTWLAEMQEEVFREIFRKSAVKRTKWRGLVRNACIALGNAAVQPGTEQAQHITELLGRLSRNGDNVIAESARWALSRIQQREEMARDERAAQKPALG
jgi:epoxyqueuosine reductase